MSEQLVKEKDAKIPTPTSLISAEAQGWVNASISAAVKEAVSGVFASLGPILKDMAMTPEKIRAANTPYVDPAVEARHKRETEKSKADEKELRAMDAARRAACPHQDKNGKSAICLVHNYPDRMPRGVCPICHDFIEPKHWVILAPDAENPKGKAVLVDEHPAYRTVVMLESMS